MTNNQKVDAMATYSTWNNVVLPFGVIHMALTVYQRRDAVAHKFQVRARLWTEYMVVFGLKNRRKSP